MDEDKIIFTQKEQEKLNKMFEQWMYADWKRKYGNFAEMNKTVSFGNVVFAGDSITEMYPLSEMFPLMGTIYNRGISAISSKQLLDNIHAHILDLKPKQVFLLIGTNDIERDEESLEIAKNIKAICEDTLNEIPNCEMNVISIYPINEDPKYKDAFGKRTNAKIQEINKHVVNQIAPIKNVNYINVYDSLLKDRYLDEDYTFDGLHLSIKGYQVVTKILTPYIRKQ
jgi:lysophospholipase L1-like esterase